MKCPCESCSPGNAAPTYTRAHMLACLARHLRDWLPEERKTFLLKLTEGKSEEFKLGLINALKDER